MLVDAAITADLPLEVWAARAFRSAAARRARLVRRRRARRRTLVLAATAVCALVAVPAPNDASRPPITAAAAGRCPVPDGLRNAFVVAAGTTRLPLGLLAAVARIESRFSVDAESPAGAIGVMQLMPSTADALHLDALQPSANVLGGAVYLRQLLSRYDGNLQLALAAYNAGPTAVDRAGGAPSDETRAYVEEVEQTSRSYGFCT